jgi:phosphatidylserine/phosphatidylglycerophosphate/cardiolipin synthase-like enzyme
MEDTLPKITAARAYANNEVAYIAWDTDGLIPGCLGFELTRLHLKADGSVAERVPCAAWVSFKGQKNPLWLPQDTGVWPIQKMSWRDLTVRKKRNHAARRPDEVTVRYEIRPVGDLKPGLPPVPSNGLETQTVVKKDAAGKPVFDAAGKPVRERVRAYEGTVRPLGYLADAVTTNDVVITSRRGPFRSTFTNGILAAQWLSNVLLDDGVIKPNELLDMIADPDNPYRKYLAGDVLPLIRELFARPGEFFLALYELQDIELEEILVANAARIHIILANSGVDKSVWDARNAPARDRLVKAGADIQHRMFNNDTHIGHNKFVVHVPPGGAPRAVLTGSTNWTQTGVAGQTNNAILVENDEIAGAYLDYWTRMKADALTLPNPLGKAMNGNGQGAAFRTANVAPRRVTLPDGGSVEIWCSPNTKEQQKPSSKTKPTPVPPDLKEVYRRMRLAKETILFLAFYPGQAGNDCIIGEAIDIGRKDGTLLVSGAVSSPQAMPGYTPDKKDPKTGKVIEEGSSPVTFEHENVSVVRAAAIDDRNILGDFGVEHLTAKNTGAIIHDKLVVIDPLSADCSVIMGSHNLGFKASYSNDENFLIVSGHRDLAIAYAVHILDVYDHYRFRAIETERARAKKSRWSGYLETTDAWQDGYVSHRKGAMMRYFAGAALE